jgi:hypothetical protein
MNQNNECLEFRKDIDGGITLVVEARVNYGGRLCPVTIYRKKKQGGTTLKWPRKAPQTSPFGPFFRLGRVCRFRTVPGMSAILSP